MVLANDLSARTSRLDYLWLAVDLDDENGTLALLRNSSSSAITPRERLAIGVSTQPAGMVVTIGSEQTPVADEIKAGELAYGAVHDRVASWARSEGWARIHAGLADIGGRRLMIAGPSGVGKTTTIIALASQGAIVLGDEAVLVRAGQAIALPRPFHAKHAGRHIDGLRPEAVLAVLHYPDPIAILDPAAINRVDSVRHEPKPIDLIVLLERGTGELPGAESVGVADAIIALAPDAGPFTPDRAELIRSVIGLAESAPVVRLRMSTPAATAHAIAALA